MKSISPSNTGIAGMGSSFYHEDFEMRWVLKTIEQHADQIEWFLKFAIVSFLVASVVILLLLFTSRLRRLRAEKRAMVLQPIIDGWLFQMVFDNREVQAVVEAPDFQTQLREKLFKKRLLRSTVRLHREYKGDHARKLEEFYQASGLEAYSLMKLRRGDWSARCEAIRDLSQMRVAAAFADCWKNLQARNEVLVLEALLGVVKLRGLAHLGALDDLQLDINDWILANVLQALDDRHQVETQQIEQLLACKTPSLVLLGLWLAKIHQFAGVLERLPALRAPEQHPRVHLLLQQLYPDQA